MKEKNEWLETARLDENYDHVHTYVLYHRKSIFVDHTFKRERLEGSHTSNKVNSEVLLVLRNPTKITKSSTLPSIALGRSTSRSLNCM